MKKQQSGFTLIELVIVIVILGLLAATALPRFADLTDDASAAARSGVVGGLASSISIAHAQWLVNGSSGNVTLDGGAAITMNASGYPNVTSYIGTTTCSGLVTSLLSSSNGLTVSNDGTNCTVDGTTSYTNAVTISDSGAVN